jgi:hypothetical protein
MKMSIKVLQSENSKKKKTKELIHIIRKYYRIKEKIMIIDLLSLKE